MRMRRALIPLLVFLLLALAGCLGGGAENRESESAQQDAPNEPDDCPPGVDRGAGGSDDDASQGGGRDACGLPAGDGQGT